MAESDNRDYRKAAAILLGQKDKFDAIKVLKKLCYDNIEDVRREAVLSLGRIGHIDAIPILREKMNDKHYQVRVAVVKALGNIYTAPLKTWTL